MILPEDITFLKESVGMCLLFVFQYVLKRKKNYFGMTIFLENFSLLRIPHPALENISKTIESSRKLGRVGLW